MESTVGAGLLGEHNGAGREQWKARRLRAARLRHARRGVPTTGLSMREVAITLAFIAATLGRTYCTYGYYPGVLVPSGFYGWGYHPWGAPIAWGIGGLGDGEDRRGYGFYGANGGYPYPAYAAPYYWLDGLSDLAAVCSGYGGSG